MTQACQRSFDSILLSGFVDGELTQADAQQVRVHVQQCPECRRTVGDLRQIREAAMSTPFPSPTDEEWQERPRSAASRWSRRAGWAMLVIWLAIASGLAIQGFLESTSVWYRKAFVALLVGGGLLLFLSVLMDRLKALRTDRYRRVKK